MLRIRTCVSAAAAKQYFREGFVKDDYYTEGKAVQGQWFGKGAERLGLFGAVEKKDFFRLCDNRTPQGEKLTPRDKANRRVGFDFTFTAPKGVSVLYERYQDPSILHAFNSAIDTAMEAIQANTQTRVRQNGQNEDRPAPEVIAARFVHETSRPVETAQGWLPDPHLHCHTFVMNAVWDPIEQRFKAAQLGDMRKETSYYESIFHGQLAWNLRSLGYDIERKGKYFDIAGIPERVIYDFSGSARRNDEFAEKQQITDKSILQEFKDRLRQTKAKSNLTLPELRQKWRERASGTHGRILDELQERARARRGQAFDPNLSSKETLDYALQHHLERESIIGENKLGETAIRRAFGALAPAQILNALKERRDLLREVKEGKTYLTTRAVKEEEEKLVDYAKLGRDSCGKLGAYDYQPPLKPFNRGQRRALQQLMDSRDRVLLFEGRAGVGKTTLLKEVVRGIEQNGRQAFVFAPSAEASRGMLRNEGFEAADTVANLTQNAFWKDKLKDQVIIIDEAGMLGTRQLRQVFELANETNARVLLAGDGRQHGAVERGALFHLMREYAKLPSAFVDEIMRQKGNYRDAVKLAADGRSKEAFELIDKLGWVRQIGHGENRYAQAANEYVHAMREKKTALVVSPTHKEGQKANEAIRERLKEEGLLERKDREFTRLRDLNATQAQKTDPNSYTSGQVVEFIRNTGGDFRARTRWRVTEKTDEKVLLKSGDGKEAELPLNRSESFRVCQPDTIALAPGDKVRLTSNGQDKAKGANFNNGSRATVAGFTREGDIRLDNGKVIDRNFGHIAHGYVSTSHAAQGKTYDRVVIVQGKDSEPAASLEQFYVSLSRGRERATLLTDDKQALKEAVATSSVKLTAHDLVRENAQTQATQDKEVRGVNKFEEYLKEQEGNPQNRPFFEEKHIPPVGPRRRPEQERGMDRD